MGPSERRRMMFRTRSHVATWAILAALVAILGAGRDPAKVAADSLEE
jgi:hypothetical protein